MLPVKAAVNRGAISLALSIILFSSVTHAQTTNIASVSAAAYTRFQNQFYVIGGGRSTEVKPSPGAFLTQPQSTVGDGQMAVLDLSVPWSSDKPAWKKLAQGPKQMGFSAAMNANGTKLIAFRANTTFAQIYDVATNTWTASSVQVPQPNQLGIDAVLNPLSDTVFLAGGYEGNDLLDQMYVYHWDSDSMTKIPLGVAPMAQMMYYRSVWWSTQQSILFFGGYMRPSGNFAPTTLNMYTPATDSWSSVQTTGKGPGARSDMCVAISDDGSKLVVFGGRFFEWHTQWIMGDIYILDLQTKVWTQGQDYANPRIYSSCTIVDDTFISWGGSDASTTVNAPIILYDLKRKKYLSQFKGENPDKDFDPIAPPPKSNSNGNSNGNGGNNNRSNESDSGLTFTQRRDLIIGCVFGAFGLVWITFFCCICRQRRIRAARAQLLLQENNQKNTTTQGNRTAKKLGNSVTVKHTSITIRPAALTSPVQPKGAQTYPVMQPVGSQTYPPLPPQQGGSYPMLPIQHNSDPGSPQAYPLLQQAEQHRLSKPAAPLPRQQGGSPQVISNEPEIMSSPLPPYTSLYASSANIRNPELITAVHSEYAESSGFMGSVSSFGGQTPATGSTADLVRSPQLRSNED
ncbi:hypothetical protein FBU30_007451 [Linnemannia zychae]|nr:hypothetical protein FBU30_007451 [Linnemannia zychae]